MQANLVTAIRVALVFGVIGLYELGVYAAAGAVLLTIAVLYMDALDGIIARRLGISSDFGALFDITGDRIVENVFWVYFAAVGMVSFWAAAIIVARSFIVDWLRTLAFARKGDTPFGKKSMMHTRWAAALVSSRFSRALYGFTKAIVFVYLGVLLFFAKGESELGWNLDATGMAAAVLAGQVIVWVTVTMCLVRGLPVVWESRDLLMEEGA